MALKKKAKKKPVKSPAKKLVKKPAKKKLFKKNPVKKKLLKKVKPGASKKLKENVIGVVTHYFPHVRAAVIKLKGQLSVNDSIKIKGHTTDFTQVISSIQIDRTSIQTAKKGQEIGLLVDSRVRQHDQVYKV